MALAFFNEALVWVRGGGDLASGVIYRLHRAGFPVVVTELPDPLFVRRTVCFGEAVYSGQVTVEGVIARLVTNADEAQRTVNDEYVAVLVDPAGIALRELAPVVLVDGRIAKRNLGTDLDSAPLVIALGPGFTAGTDCHVVIETNRGHDLGRAIYVGTAELDTGQPGIMQGHSYSRVLRAPAAGQVRAQAAIGDMVRVGQVLAEVAGQPVVAPFAGVLRGLIHERVRVEAGMKIGDLDPRARRENCFTISDKSLSVGGGVLEAVLAAPQVRAVLMRHETTNSI